MTIEEILVGKTVKQIERYGYMVQIDFTDGTSIIIDADDGDIEITYYHNATGPSPSN